MRKYRKKPLKLHAATLRKLNRYPWPGNVRELQHTMEKAVILAESDVLKPEDFDFHTHSSQAAYTTETLEHMEDRLIRAALDKNHDNLALTAKQLGISRQTLYNKLKRHEP